MDFRIIKEGGETNISNNDIMYMQYSNYFGLNAIGAGLDVDNEGVSIAGCQLQATFNQSDDTITASITDGYIVINGKQIKCESTPSIQFPFTYLYGYRRTAYIYAEVTSSFNPLGDKIYVDLTQNQTWKEDRIQLSYSFSSTPLAGTVLVGSCYVGGTQGGTPEALIINQNLNNVAQSIIKQTGNSDIVTTHRGGRDNECVSVSNLYQAFDNYGIMRLTSTSRTNDGSFQFSIPSGSDVYLISAKADLTSDSNYSYGNIFIDNTTWFVNKNLNTLTVSFGDLDLVNFATALVCLNRTL